jgi:predicted DCC family thiol-disulfide oxidoreductase YuxK
MDTSNEFRFCSLSSKFGASILVAHGKEPDDKNSIMVIVRTGEISNDGFIMSHFLQKSDAVMVIASKLEGTPSWVKAMTALGAVARAALSNWLLQIIADNRYRVAGQLEDSCRLDLDGEYEGRFLNDYEHMHLFEPLDLDYGLF